MPRREPDPLPFYMSVLMNAGAFGLVSIPKDAQGYATHEKIQQTLQQILEKYSFPSLNLTMTAAARLLPRRDKAAKVQARLQEYEASFTVEPLDAKEQPLPGDSELSLLGIFPDETVVNAKDSFSAQAPFQLQPNVGALLSALPGLATAAAIVSALGIAFRPFFGPRYKVLSRPFIAGARSFGWYYRSHEEHIQEGIHYAMALWQASREVGYLRVTGRVLADWKNVAKEFQNYQWPVKETLKVIHPPVPQTPLVVPAPTAT